MWYTLLAISFEIRPRDGPFQTIFPQQQEQILTMTATGSNGFAFIVDRHPLPSPYLVHMSRMSKTTKKNLDFFKPNVIYLPRTMNFILKPLLHNDELFNLHRQVLKEAMLEVMTSNNYEALNSNAILQTLGVESVAKQEISRVLDAVPLTRHNEHKFNKIMSNWRELRMNRLRNEHYLPSTFIADVQRSKIELTFIIKQLKM
jgi:hypothetical protein